MDKKACTLSASFLDSLTVPIDTSHTDIPRSDLPTTPPPAINWSTKPKGYRLVPSGQGVRNPQVNVEVHEVESTGCPSVNNPLRELCRHLGYPPHPGLALSKPQDRRSLALSELQDGRSSHNDPSEFLDLTAAFSHLSTSNNPALLEARTLPGILLRASSTQLSPRKNPNKYYAITIGKCAGVYYGEW